MPTEAFNSGSRAPGVRMAVVNHRIQAIVSKMHNTLLRTARSGVINNGRDFSCCVLTANARLLSVGQSLPIHVMVGADMMARCMGEYHPVLKAGDAFLHNSPYHGCSHAADLSILVPVIDEQGMHRFTVMAKAHQADIGNSIPTTYHATARDVYEEGALIFPAVKVQAHYQDIEDVTRIAKLRIRVPEIWYGDYLASLGAARIGERELLELGAQVGWHSLEEHIDEWFDYSERRMRTAIAKLPSGRATGVCVHDTFPGTPPAGISVQACIEVDSANHKVSVDLRNNLDCMDNGLNLSEACSRSAALIGVFNALDEPDIPPNAGSFRCIDVLLRENCVVGIPRHPTSCSVATSNVSDRLIGAVQMAMAKFGPHFGMAEFGGCQTAAQAVVSGDDPRSENAPFVNQLIMGDTLGAASASEDAWLTLITAGTAGLGLLDSIEVNELRHPLLVHQRRIVADSEGAGTYTGAPASMVEFGPTHGPMRVVYQSDGTDNPPQGVSGGLAGQGARNFIKKSNGEVTSADGWADIVLVQDESIVGISCGGGGYGPPWARETARVIAALEEGYLSCERAETIYGVILNDEGGLDEEASARRRAALRDWSNTSPICQSPT